ncbi:MAG: 5-methyltetrahydrofolate--homocysteine methyltransferase, partial [Spirochaetales bacterium]|nr:5-methyltetrahydrofolate--homocysteine methyltransferase [Spirochaetales bacterium]
AYVFSHPGSTYWALGRIDQEQLADWAERQHLSLTDAQRRLAPVLEDN